MRERRWFTCIENSRKHSVNSAIGWVALCFELSVGSDHSLAVRFSVAWFLSRHPILHSANF